MGRGWIARLPWHVFFKWTIVLRVAPHHCTTFEGLGHLGFHNGLYFDLFLADAISKQQFSSEFNKKLHNCRWYCIHVKCFVLFHLMVFENFLKISCLESGRRWENMDKNWENIDKSPPLRGSNVTPDGRWCTTKYPVSCRFCIGFTSVICRAGPATRSVPRGC